MKELAEPTPVADRLERLLASGENLPPETFHVERTMTL